MYMISCEISLSDLNCHTQYLPCAYVVYGYLLCKNYVIVQKGGKACHEETAVS